MGVAHVAATKIFKNKTQIHKTNYSSRNFYYEYSDALITSLPCINISKLFNICRGIPLVTMPTHISIYLTKYGRRNLCPVDQKRSRPLICVRKCISGTNLVFIRLLLCYTPVAAERIYTYRFPKRVKLHSILKLRLCIISR